MAIKRVLQLGLVTAFIITSTGLRAEVRPHSLFSDGAVLQAGVNVPVWGTGKEDEKVTVRFQGQTVSTTVKGGKWIVTLKPLKAGGPNELVIEGENKLTVRNVLVGEVWLCSGQSNMAFKLARAEGGLEAALKAADPQLRFFQVPHEASDEAKQDISASWLESTPSTASNFSAVAYYFGRALRNARNTPIGLIDASVGGTPAEAWTSSETLARDPELKKLLEKYAESVRTYDPEKAHAQHERAKAKHKEAVAKAKSEGSTPPRAPTAPSNPARSSKRPSGLYNGMIAPLQPYAIAGVIWYQGEANSGRAEEYQKLFPAMIQNWRTGFQRNFPFLFVQIAPHERMSPEIREAQLLTAMNVPKTAVVVTTDVGNATDIHPTRKEPVGSRLALCAQALAYGEKVEYWGPVLESTRAEGQKVILRFTHATGGLVAKGGPLRGFTVAGPDGKHLEAKAEINGEMVVVSCTQVPKPSEVQYGWANVPDVNLFNGAGLPASPFRSQVKAR